MSVDYLDDSLVTAVRTSEPPYYRTSSGYGSKIPSQYELQINNRWYRVYTIIYSNAGSNYIIMNKKHIYLGQWDPRWHPVQLTGKPKQRRRRW